MNRPAISARQGGALSLLWCAILTGVVAAAGMAALMSLRHERNLFREAWAGFMKAPVVKTVNGIGREVQHASSTGEDIRRRTVDGKVMYSNVECGPDRSSSRNVFLHDSRGIEPPKAIPADAPEEAPASMQDRRIEKAMQEKPAPR